MEDENLVRTYDFPLTTNDQSIDRVLNAGLPVVLIFLDAAPPPALDAAMNRLAKEHAGSLLVVRAPLADSSNAAARYGVRHGPAVITARGGQEVSRADNADALALEQHSLYLLGKGPRPAAAKDGGAASARPVAVTDDSFAREVMGSDLPVVVDFWAPWCGPCRSVAPALDRLAQEWSGRVKIAKINVDENPLVMRQFGVQGIPTMLVVKNGKIVDRWVGALPEAAIRGRLAKVL
jgi:thioredoxin 1